MMELLVVAALIVLGFLLFSSKAVNAVSSTQVAAAATGNQAGGAPTKLADAQGSTISSILNLGGGKTIVPLAEGQLKAGQIKITQTPSGGIILNKGVGILGFTLNTAPGGEQSLFRQAKAEYKSRTVAELAAESAAYVAQKQRLEQESGGRTTIVNLGGIGGGKIVHDYGNSATPKSTLSSAEQAALPYVGDYETVSAADMRNYVISNGGNLHNWKAAAASMGFREQSFRSDRYGTGTVKKWVAS